MQTTAHYPSPQHARAADAILSRYTSDPDIESVLLTNSCARGKASVDSCLDIAILLRPEVLSVRREQLEREWEDAYKSEEVYDALRRVGRFSVVHLDFVDGCFVPAPVDQDHGPDWFEVEIGNLLRYAVPLDERGDYLHELKTHWLPYYDEVLRQERLEGVRRSCLHHLDHIPLYVDRALYFQSFYRLQVSFERFLEALFISRRTYPIAYNKWIREQVEEILGLPDLYRQLPRLFEIANFESQKLSEKPRYPVSRPTE